MAPLSLVQNFMLHNNMSPLFVMQQNKIYASFNQRSQSSSFGQLNSICMSSTQSCTKIDIKSCASCSAQLYVPPIPCKSFKKDLQGKANRRSTLFVMSLQLRQGGQ